MTITVISEPKSQFPIKKTCPSCEAELEVGSAEDLIGYEDVREGVSVWFICPRCNNSVYLDHQRLTYPEIQTVLYRVPQHD
jgi:hypothetical protein